MPLTGLALAFVVEATVLFKLNGFFIFAFEEMTNQLTVLIGRPNHLPRFASDNNHSSSQYLEQSNTSKGFRICSIMMFQVADVLSVGFFLSLSLSSEFVCQPPPSNAADALNRMRVALLDEQNETCSQHFEVCHVSYCEVPLGAAGNTHLQCDRSKARS